MYVQNDYHYTSSVTNMLRELKWSSGLVLTNTEFKLVTYYATQILNKQVYVDHSHLTKTTNSSLKNNKKK